MTRPLLLIDVDGPLNPFAAPRLPEGYTEHLMRPPSYLAESLKPRAYVEPLKVWLNPAHGAALRDLPFELWWCSTWGEEANQFIAPQIGLPDLRVVPLGKPKTRPDRTCWKTWDVARWCMDVPFAWVDDDIGQADRAYVQAVHNAPSFLLSIDPVVGLVDADFDRLRTWAESLL